jgi:hypothetical protein
MPFVCECPSCGKKLKIPDDLMGRTVRCSDCAGTFIAELARSPVPPLPSRRDDEFDERPSRRRPMMPDTSGMMPHRGVITLIFGIIALVTALLSGGTVLGGGAAGAVTGGIGLVVAGGGVVFNILGLVFGILSWVWGSRDLALMKAGVMDPTGHGMTLGGYVCGIIGTILNALALILTCVVSVLVMLGMAAVFGTFCCLFSAAAKSMPPPNSPPPRRFEAPTVMHLRDYLPRHVCQGAGHWTR